jgi:hypothetical protein
MSKKRLIQIEKRIKKIKSDIILIGEMRPGSLTLQYKDPKKKTGANYQISYTLNMKSRTDYVRKNCVKETRQQIASYKKFKKLSEEWVTLGIEHAKISMKVGLDNG